LIALAYYVIPVTLVYFVRKRRDLPFHWMFFMFGMFIFGCGTTHAMEIWTLWHGTYRLAGVIKALTAAASMATAVALVPLIPRALLLPSPGQLSAANLELEKEIGERRRTEIALRESEERFRNMANTAPVMIWVAGPDKLCTFFNKCCLDFTGHSLDQKIGNGWIGGVHPEDREQFLGMYSSSFDAHQEFQTVFRLRRADGEYRWMLTTGAPRWTSDGVFAGFIGSCVDITDLKRTQEEALARQKLESLGVLAGGIAHDFNNLLGGILAEAEVVESDLAAGLSPDC
jgi:PAS domain S-box-containing protein